MLVYQRVSASTMGGEQNCFFFFFWGYPQTWPMNHGIFWHQTWRSWMLYIWCSNVKTVSHPPQCLPCLSGWVAISALRCWNAERCEYFWILGGLQVIIELFVILNGQIYVFLCNHPNFKTNPYCTLRSLSHHVLRSKCHTTLLKPIAESHSQTPNSRMVCDEDPSATSVFWGFGGRNLKGSPQGVAPKNWPIDPGIKRL